VIVGASWRGDGGGNLRDEGFDGEST